MNVKEIKTPEGKLIKIYNDMFTYRERVNFTYFVNDSLFLTSGSSLYGVGNQIYSNYVKEDVEKMGFFSTEGYKRLDKEYNLSKRNVKKYRINLSTPFEKYQVHSDNCDITLLYYINLDWKIENGGHTIFFDEYIKESVYTSLFEPGKLIIFDGNIPHVIMPFNSIEYGNRFTLAIQYDAL